jgi:PIN domain nuclease of toxin-antitoxin system
LISESRLSETAAKTIREADTILLSPVSIFEVAQKVRLGKWAEMAPIVERLPAVWRDQGGLIADLEPEICIRAGMMAWSHRDPFDRLIAATALHRNASLLSVDTVFDGVVSRVW